MKDLKGSLDKKKWLEIKNRTTLLLKNTPDKKGDVVCFSTRQNLNNVIFIHKRTLLEQSESIQKNNTEKKDDMKEDSSKPNWVSIFLLVVGFLFVFLVSRVSKQETGRKPMGEYSSLIENNKAQEDFSTNEEMLRYIQEEDLKYEDQKGR